MKKKVKFRFIKEVNSDRFKVQKKGIFFWKTFGYWAGSCSGDSVWNDYHFYSEEDAMKKLKEHEDSKSATFIQYPTIIIH